MALHPYEIDRGFPFDENGSDRFTGNASVNLVKDNRGIRYRWRAITIKNGKAVLAGANDKIKGAFLYFDSGRAVVRCQSAGIKYKNAGNSAIATESAIIGATRTLVSGGTAENGFVQAAPDIANAFNQGNIQNAIKGVGYVINGGGTHANNSDPPADVIVQQGLS